MPQDRAIRAHEAQRADRSTESIEALAREDEAWLAHDLPKVLRKLRRLGVPEACKEALPAVVLAGRRRGKVV